MLTSVATLRRQVAAWRRAGETVALVPTMGALHAGHLSLARLAMERADRCIVSIFVNPTQFGPGEDFGTYPRSLESDVAQLGGLGVPAVFTPDPSQMYPEGFCTTIALGGPAEAGLEDRFRPTHFAGVATVVAKLLIQSMPDLAVFGEKDFQQLAVIRRLAVDLDLPTLILGAPTLREADGLAMSSRNIYLSAEERRTAPLLRATLGHAAEAIAGGGEPGAAIERACETIEQGGFRLDYLEFRDAASLGPAVRGQAARLLVAARLGRTRLIDNVAVSFGGESQP